MAHQPGFDRIVFEFEAPLGLPLLVDAFLAVNLRPMMVWGIGLELECPQVLQLASPERLVVDLPTPP